LVVGRAPDCQWRVNKDHHFSRYHFSIEAKPPNAGWYGQDDRYCQLKLVAAKDGRIVTASIVQDMPGRTTTSRCLELFKPA